MVGDLITRDGQTFRKGRVSPALRSAIRLIVEQGLSIPEAAQQTGYKWESLAKALVKPHVKAERAAVKRAWLASQTDKAWLGMAQLADGAASEDVRHKSLKVFLEAAGELGGKVAEHGPQTLVQIVMHHASAAEQPTSHRLPGVIEHQPQQRVRPDPSNLITVGRGSAAPQDAP